MSSTNPSQPYSPSSQSPGQDTPSRPGASSRPSDQHTPGPEEGIDQEHQPQTPAATHDGASEPTVNPANTSAANDDGGEAPPFQSFFTLIEDAHTAEYHHPTVHYIFSDDDTDIVTEAALRSLEAQQDAQAGAKGEQRQRREEFDENGKSTLLPPPIPGVRENYIVLDVEPVTAAQPPSNSVKTKPDSGDGKQTLSTSPAQTQDSAHPPSKTKPDSQQFRVTSAKSFSPTWQVLSSEIVPAPTFDNGSSGDTPGQGLMLKIHGTGGIPYDIRKETADSGSRKLEEMMDQFAKRMRELQMIIDTADVGGEEEGEQADPTEAAEKAKDEPESEVVHEKQS